MALTFEVVFKVPEDEAHLMPADAVHFSFNNMADVPATNDFILLAPRSMWQVSARVWDRPSQELQRVTLWLFCAPEMLVVTRRPPLRQVPPEPPDA